MVVNTLAFLGLYIEAEDNVTHIIAHLQAIKGVVMDNPQLRDTIVVNLLEKRAPDPSLPDVGRAGDRALGVDWGRLYVTSPQIDGQSGYWPAMP